jgi:proline iminopeptidase
MRQPLPVPAVLAAAAICAAACAAPPPAGDGTARVNGVDLHFFVAGEGPVLVVQPGEPGFEWKILRMPLVEKFATVVYLDPRGSGRSSRPGSLEDYRMSKMVEDLDALRLHLGLGRIALMGHAHGGMVAQLYALAHPESLRKLILSCTVADTGPDWRTDVERLLKLRSAEPGYADAAAALAEQAGARSEDRLRDVFMRELPLYFYRWEPFKDRMRALIADLRISPDPLRAFTELDAPAFDTRRRLGTLRVPTLIAAGRHDVFGSPERAAEMHGLMINSRLAVFEQSGHFPYIEEDEAFALTLHGFLMED